MIARNPQTVHEPLAAYAHQIEIAPGGRWLVMSGQVGMRQDRTIPADPVEQLQVVLENIRRNLREAGADVGDLVKLTFYLVGPIDPAARRSVVEDFLDGHTPCTTLLYVQGLASDDLRVEVDAWAHLRPDDEH